MIVRDLGQDADYLDTWSAMRDFTLARDEHSIDELWVCQHPSVYTLGQAGKPEHILNPRNIPVVQSDRGGQVTWHGPGQLVFYPLLDLRRLGIGVRTLVERLEASVIRVLADEGVEARPRREAPGVYVGEAKVAALGLRVRHARSYHGLSVNIDNDLAPFLGINPCGYENLEVTTFRKLGLDTPLKTLQERLIGSLEQHLCEPGPRTRPPA